MKQTDSLRNMWPSSPGPFDILTLAAIAPLLLSYVIVMFDVANIAWAKTAFAVNFFLVGFALFLLLVMKVNRLVAVLSLPAGKVLTESPSKIRLVVSTILLLHVAFLMYMVVNTPAFAWDSLSWWLWNAQYFAEQKTVLQIDGSFIPRETYPNRHPITVSVIAVLPHLLWGNDDAWIISALLWLLPLVGTWGAIFSVGYALNCGRLPVALSVAAITSAPLIENHVIAFGYTEIWTTFLMVASLAYFLIFLRTRRLIDLIIGVLALLAMAGIRNTSLIYVTIPVLSAAYIHRNEFTIFQNNGFSSGTLGRLSCIVIILLCWSWIYASEVSVKDFGIVIAFAGWVQAIELQNVGESAWAFVWSLLVNSSFSLIFLSALFAWLFAVLNKGLALRKANLLGMCFALGLATFVLIACFSEYFFANFRPNSDTLGSRSMLPILSLGIVLVLSIFERK